VGELIEAVTVPVNARRRLEWVRGEQQLLSAPAARHGVDLVHSLASTAPSWGRFRRVVTIHDLTYRIVPEAHLGLLGVGMRVLVPLAARGSHRIIVDAASTRDDLTRLLRVQPQKVDVAPLGVSRRGVEPTPEAELRSGLSAGTRPIVVSVSARRPHKNIARLIGALALIPSSRRPVLVVRGYRTPHEDELRRRADELGRSEDVRLLGWVDDSTLEGLYPVAACFVFPSLVRGLRSAGARGDDSGRSGRVLQSRCAGRGRG
jgi:glycosyltransferase involved in cell wall biosynthesis